MPLRSFNNANSFCYVCSDVIFSNQKRQLVSYLKTKYYHYFGVNVGGIDKSWLHHICYNTSSVNLNQRFHKKIHAFPFEVPVVWERTRTLYMTDISLWHRLLRMDYLIIKNYEITDRTISYMSADTCRQSACTWASRRLLFIVIWPWRWAPFC